MQEVDLQIGTGKAPLLQARIRVTSFGILSIAGLVSSILLSTAVIVRVAKGRNSDKTMVDALGLEPRTR